MIPEPIRRILDARNQADDPYQAGFDCGLNGANTTNCNFALFSTKERTQQWEQGKRDGEKQRETK